MPVSKTLLNCVRNAAGSFARLWPRQVPARSARNAAPERLIYRLRYWPNLPNINRTADVLRLLSAMSNRPVNRHWLLAHSRLRPERVDWLLERLVARGAVEVFDSSQFLAKQR